MFYSAAPLLVQGEDEKAELNKVSSTNQETGFASNTTQSATEEELKEKSQSQQETDIVVTDVIPSFDKEPE